VLLDTDNVEVVTGKVHHFLNYIEQDNANIKFQRSKVEKVRFSIYSRATSFYEVLAQDEEMIAQQMAAIFLLNEQLIHTWRAVDNHGNPAGRNPAWIAVYNTVDEVKRYEQLLKEHALDPVLNNYSDLKLANQQNAQVLPIRHVIYL